MIRGLKKLWTSSSMWGKVIVVSIILVVLVIVTKVFKFPILGIFSSIRNTLFGLMHRRQQEKLKATKVEDTNNSKVVKIIEKDGKKIEVPVDSAEPLNAEKKIDKALQRLFDFTKELEKGQI